jgi:hypothetical protein
MRNVTPEQVAMAEQHRRGELPAVVPSNGHVPSKV